ncbi:PTS fructose transporter subunit IID [Suicoccus acidiformans]|uniref:PTS fructose transporter subunit IID n=1 Tax=Suicoccus acidiformans TaxID=2036206 RepID=A0A347WLX0_9LACT|nr:PTS system mannose/fructose/sorbose family transporter subunit IID [Suicoccus acidiformans]AXY26077.1 PTS fructose transporter subunit IID [Suicoccus acidiformans]
MESNNKTQLTKRDITRTYLRWWWTAEISNSFERMQSLAYAASMGPILEKLYGKGSQGLKDGLQRHLAFFNTQAIWGALIIGTTVAMEEQKASGEDIPDETITSFKSGLMGPLAGIGDSLDFGTIQTIFYSLAASFAVTGNFLGAFFIVAFSVIHFFVGLGFMHTGYQQGRKSIMDILQSGRINAMIQTASILGMFMMGALSANMVRLETPLEFNVSGSVINVQETLDGIVPGLLPLAAVLLVYWALKKDKFTLSQLMVIITIVCLVGAFFGIF